VDEARSNRNGQAPGSSSRSAAEALAAGSSAPALADHGHGEDGHADQARAEARRWSDGTIHRATRTPALAPTPRRRPRCRGTTKSGQPCQSFAVTKEGFCSVHGGLVDAAAIGRKGGQQRTRNLLGLDDSVADESLRAKARRKLESILDGGDSAAALRAATALYSYRSQQPPHEQQPEPSRPGGTFGVRDLVKLMADRRILEQFVDITPEDQATVAKILGSAKPIVDAESPGDEAA
jgi:hypothetical protein